MAPSGRSRHRHPPVLRACRDGAARHEFIARIDVRAIQVVDPGSSRRSIGIEQGARRVGTLAVCRRWVASGVVRLGVERGVDRVTARDRAGAADAPPGRKLTATKRPARTSDDTRALGPLAETLRRTPRASPQRSHTLCERKDMRARPHHDIALTPRFRLERRMLFDSPRIAQPLVARLPACGHTKRRGEGEIACTNATMRPSQGDGSRKGPSAR